MQQLNPSEISEIIKQRIEKLDVSSEARNEGTIVMSPTVSYGYTDWLMFKTAR